MPTLIAFFLENWPPSFLGTRLDALSNGALCWRTIQNRRSRREIPEKCFAKISPRKVLILRDPFLAWLASEMEQLAPTAN